MGDHLASTCHIQTARLTTRTVPGIPYSYQAFDNLTNDEARYNSTHCCPWQQQVRLGSKYAQSNYFYPNIYAHMQGFIDRYQELCRRKPEYKEQSLEFHEKSAFISEKHRKANTEEEALV